jgi:hypothetical protein
MKTMKTLFISLIFAAAALAQTVTVSIASVSPGVIADIHTHWLDQVSPQTGVIVEAMDATPGPVTVTISQATLTASSPMPRVGQTLLFAGEVAPIVAVSGLSITIARGAVTNSGIAAHSAGAAVYVLRHASPWEMVATEALRPWMQSVIQQLGARSVTLGGIASGSVQ